MILIQIFGVMITMTRSELSFFFTNRFCNIKTEKDIYIRQRVEDHLIDAINNGMNPHDIVFIALEGSQNYGLDTETSDVDTKLIVLPTLDDVIYGRKMVSTTACRKNEEHTNYTDIRFFFPTLKRQNINFVETIFSPWIIVNREYEDEIAPLFENRELIARYNEVKSVKTIAGIAKDRYKAIQNLNSYRANIIKTYGYDGKAISHLVRLDEFLDAYIKGFSYSTCLHCPIPEYVKEFKANTFPKEYALEVAKDRYELIQLAVDRYTETHKETINPEVDKILDEVQKSIIKKSLRIN